MQDSTPKVEDSIDDSLIEDISKIQQIALGERAVLCQVSGSKLPDGTPVTVYAYRPAGQPTYDIGYILRKHADTEIPTYFTLGVRELIVDGHIGRCVDPVSDTSWPVLLDPKIRAVSPMDTTTCRIAPDPTTTDSSSSKNTSTDEMDSVSWVYGDELLKRTSTYESGTDAEAESNTEAEPEAEAESTSRPDSQSQSRSRSDTDPNPDSDSNTGPNAESASTPQDTRGTSQTNETAESAGTATHDDGASLALEPASGTVRPPLTPETTPAGAPTAHKQPIDPNIPHGIATPTNGGDGE